MKNFWILKETIMVRQQYQVSLSVIEYEKNPNYWDKDNVKIDNVKLTSYDG